MSDEIEESGDSLSSQSPQTCPVCLETKDVLVCDGSPNSCRHGLCKTCANRLLLGTKPAPSSLSSVTQGFVLPNDDENDEFNFNDLVEKESLLQQCVPAIPTLGQCPICRGVWNLFELREYAPSSSCSEAQGAACAPSSLSTEPAFAKDRNVSNWPIAGCSFELNNMGFGKGSLHFPSAPSDGDIMVTDEPNTATDLAQTTAYLNFEALSDNNNTAGIASSLYAGKWKRDDDSSPPPRLYFEPDSQHFHHQSRTFHGTLRWNKDKPGATLNHAATWDVILQFSSDLRYVSSGAILARPLSSVDRSKIANDSFSLDGIWRLAWWTREEAKKDKIKAWLQVSDGEFHMSSLDLPFHLHHKVERPSAGARQWSLIPDTQVECQFMGDAWAMVDYQPPEKSIAEPLETTKCSDLKKETNAPPNSSVPVGSTLVWRSCKEKSEKRCPMMELHRLGINAHFMDGIWKVTWTSLLSERGEVSQQSATISVVKGRWSLNGISFALDLTTNPYEPRFEGPPGFEAAKGYNEKELFKAQHVDLAAQVEDPAVGTVIAWTSDGTNADPQLKWTFESKVCTSSTRVELVSPRYSMSFRRIHDASEATAQLQYHRGTLWGNVFAQRMSVGLASYHFISPDGVDEAGAYISYESPLCSVWPPLDDGSPVSSRVPFSNIDWDADSRTFRGRIEWFQRYGCSWQGSTAWRYEMVFDTEYTCIVGGQVWTTVEGVTEEQEMSQYGRELIYFNATIVDHFHDLIQARYQEQERNRAQNNDESSGDDDQGQIDSQASRAMDVESSVDSTGTGIRRNEASATTSDDSQTNTVREYESPGEDRSPAADGSDGFADLSVGSEETRNTEMEPVTTPELQMAEALQNIAARVRRLEGRVEAVTPLANRLRAASRITPQDNPNGSVRIHANSARRRSRTSETNYETDEEAEARARRTTVAAEVARSLSTRVEEEGASDRLVRHFRAVLASTVRRSSSRSSLDDAY